MFDDLKNKELKIFTGVLGDSDKIFKLNLEVNNKSYFFKAILVIEF